MPFDFTKSFDIDENGIALRDDDSNTIGHWVAGNGDPTGTDSPINTWYFRQDTQTIFYKFGAGLNDWRQIRANDIAFDPSQAQNLSATNIFSALNDLSNRHYGKDASDQTRDVSETVTGGAFQTYDTLNFVTTAESNPNRYRLNAEFFWGHNSASNDIRVQLLLDGTPFPEIRIEPKDPNADQRIQNNIVAYATNLSAGPHTLTLQYRPATASRVSRMFRSVLEVWRTA